MRWPTFLIIGAGRSGTTSLYHYLGQHPDIFMSPVKEPGFFAYEDETRPLIGAYGEAELPGYSTRREDYEALFADVSVETAAGEASVDYLYLPRAARRIRRHVPQARLIAILRQPADRSHSQFWARVASGREPLTDFEEALRAERGRIDAGWAPEYHYKQKSFYSAAIRRYLDLFGESRLKVFLHDDFDTAPLETVREISRFVGVDEPTELDTSRRYNLRRGRPANHRLASSLKRAHLLKESLKAILPAHARSRLRAWLEPRSWAPRPPLHPDLRAQLTAEFEEDIVELQSLLHRDLSHWLDPRTGEGPKP